jgi:hypothetical protein
MEKIETLYYFFSALAQTYGAIVGLIGMLTAYRLQQLGDYSRHAANDESKTKYVKVTNGTKDRFIHFLIWNIIIIFLSLILLPFCEILLKSDWKYFWVSLLVVLVVGSLILTISLCLFMTENNFIKYLSRLLINIKEHTLFWKKKSCSSE